MKNEFTHHISSLALLLFGILVAVSFLNASAHAATTSVTIRGNVGVFCGNDTKDVGETCDGADFGGETCVTQGFDGGSLSCISSCTTIDTSGCTTAPTTPPSTGNGGLGSFIGAIIGGIGEIISPPPPKPPPPKCQNPADFNNDCRVDIVDLSIFLAHYERTDPDSLARFDLNHDRTVGLSDLSIVLYYWEG